MMIERLVINVHGVGVETATKAEVEETKAQEVMQQLMDSKEAIIGKEAEKAAHSVRISGALSTWRLQAAS